MAGTEGAKVTLCDAVPALGDVVGVVHAKLPATEAVPPVSVEDASVWPYVIGDAVGHADTDGVALLTVIVVCGDVAAPKFPVADTLAVTTTEPAPVKVRTPFDSVAGPETSA